MGDAVDVQDAPDAHRFEARMDGRLAGFAAYRLQPGHITFTHTEVADDLAGHGVGGRSASVALDDARSRGLRVTPRCPFIAAYIKRHPAYADLVAAS